LKLIQTEHTLFESLDVGDDELAEISLILEMRRNFSMSVYKDKCMKRRVAIRMRSNRCHDAAAYCALLRSSELELDLLQKALTIHVSQFFRNPTMFEKLRSEIIPLLYRISREREKTVRIWSLGSAGGEEAYSIALILRDYFARELRDIPTTIDATDIDADILQAARNGLYNEDRLKDLPADMRERYFHPNGNRIQLASVIREMVTFARNDMTITSAYQPHELVVCRNTLIYFTRPDQEKILQGIADIIPPGGVLVLGKSETLVGNVRRHFSSICPVERMYQRI
jgi:chemotaxis protein methyltransferase CheR